MQNLTFKRGEVEVVIGRELFPLPNRKKAIVFSPEKHKPLTEKEKIRFKRFIRKLDSTTFQSGKCFKNAAIVCKIAKECHFSCDYYAGWLFTENWQYPIFHAFCLFEGILLDVSISRHLEYSLIENINKWMELYRKGNAPDYTEYIASSQVLSEKSRPATTKDCIFGDPVDRFYVGVKTNEIQAQITYKNILKKKNHPSLAPVTHSNGATELNRKINDFRKK